MGRWGLWPILWTSHRGRSRRFGFTFEGLCGTLDIWMYNLHKMHNFI